MGNPLSAADRDRYREQGFLAPITVMAEEEALACRRRLEAAEAQFGRMHYVTKPHLLLLLADELVHRGAILDAVEAIIGPDILLWDCNFIIKEAQNRKFVSWHQDLTYWGLAPDDVVSVWLALSPATRESGCMRMIPGSHRDGRVEHAATFAADNILSRGQAIASPIDERRAADIVLRPGQMSLHHGWVFHASSPNASADRRIGFNMNLIAPNVRQSRFAGDSAMLLRGHDRHGHFEPEPRPQADFAPEARALQAELNRRRGLTETGAAATA
jgi:hypothetical protein